MAMPSRLPSAPIYSTAEADMLLRVSFGSRGPGVIPLPVARQFSQQQEALLQQQIDYLSTAVAADERSIMGLQAGAVTEAQTRSSADAALQSQIAALKAQVVPLTGVLALPGGLTLLAGKSTRTVTVAGLKKNDNVVVTPNAALPASLSMAEAYSLNDGVLTVVLVNSAALGLSIGAAQSIPLGIIALRPQI